MTRDELKAKITTLLPSATYEEGGEWLNVYIDAKDWLPFAKQLREQSGLDFDFLFCLTCVDWKTHLTMVLSSYFYYSSSCGGNKIKARPY
jgi:NADH-quinone oxidoreductase subunit C